jgi:hypothetical protein
VNQARVEAPAALLRRRWLAIGAATVAMQFSVWPIVAAVTAAAEGGEDAGAPLALGLAVVPLVFVVLAVGERVHRAPGRVMAAMGAFLVLGLPLALINIVIGLLVGFGVGALVILEPWTSQGSRWRWRVLAVTTVYVALLLAVAPGLALTTMAVAPLAVVGLVDQALGVAAEGDVRAARGTVSGQRR